MGHLVFFQVLATSTIRDCVRDYNVNTDTGTYIVIADEEISPRYVSHNIMAFANVNVCIWADLLY